MKNVIDFVREVLFYGAACLVWSGVLLLDVMVFKTNCAENGIVESSQLVAIFASGVLLMVTAVKHSDKRAGLVLAGAFFIAMAIRELDQFWDGVWHGFWIVPEIAFLSVVAAFVLFHRKTIHPGLKTIAGDRDSSALSVGILIVKGFSRIIGHKTFWRLLAPGGSFTVPKRFAEESCELIGYFIILAWAMRFFSRMRAERKNENRDL